MPTRRLGLCAAALIAVGTLIGCAAPDDLVGVVLAEPLPAASIAPPLTGVATGVSIDGAPLGKPGLSAWDAWTSKVGKQALYIMWYADWSSTFQGYAMADTHGRGSIPIVTWEMKNRRSDISYADVLAGKWNKYIDTWANAAKTDGHQFFLRFGHEMNGDWY